MRRSACVVYCIDIGETTGEPQKFRAVRVWPLVHVPPNQRAVRQAETWGLCVPTARQAIIAQR
jgi:hypothetical protein